MKGKGRKPIKRISVFEQHQERIARETLKMPDAIAGVMGGPTKSQARSYLASRKKRTGGK